MSHHDQQTERIKRLGKRNGFVYQVSINDVADHVAERLAAPDTLDVRVSVADGARFAVGMIAVFGAFVALSWALWAAASAVGLSL